jgi:hypothetical protein
VRVGTDESAFWARDGQSRTTHIKPVMKVSAGEMPVYPTCGESRSLASQEGSFIMMRTNIDPGNSLSAISAPDRILQSVMVALNEGKISDIIDRFDDDFKFIDHALGLEFMDKRRLIEFLQKSRDLYPDTVVEVVSIFDCGDQAIAEWKLTATQPVPSGPISYRFPILLRGATIAQTRNGRVIRWSDYYDQATSRRFSLAAFFTDWVEL